MARPYFPANLMLSLPESQIDRNVEKTTNRCSSWAGRANLRKKRCLAADVKILPKS